jgi:hypothetical protein
MNVESTELMWGILYSILECGSFIDCHYRNLTKPKEPVLAFYAGTLLLKK